MKFISHENLSITMSLIDFFKTNIEFNIAVKSTNSIHFLREFVILFNYLTWS